MRASPRSVLRHLAPAGLRWRLAAWVALVTLICTGITFLVVYRGTGAQLRHQIDQELSGDAGELAHNLALTDPSSRRLSEAATGYIRDQPFSPSSTVLFAVVPGAGTSTNRPELFASRTPDHGETLADQLAENARSNGLLTARGGYSSLSLSMSASCACSSGPCESPEAPT